MGVLPGIATPAGLYHRGRGDSRSLPVHSLAQPVERDRPRTRKYAAHRARYRGSGRAAGMFCPGENASSGEGEKGEERCTTLTRYLSGESTWDTRLLC